MWPWRDVLGLQIKILKAGWQHDGTWPADSITSPPSPAPQLLDLPVPPPGDLLIEEKDNS